jgi:hypothetical protein
VTPHPADEVYSRSPRALWRDTGTHVLALVRGTVEHQPVLLAGGAVLLWRALEQPGDLDELTERLRPDRTDPPRQAEVASAVADLRAHGLVLTAPEAGRDDADATISR